MKITSVNVETYDCGRQVKVCVGTDTGIRRAIQFHIGTGVNPSDFKTLLSKAIETLAGWCEAQEQKSPAPLARRY